MAIQLAAGVRSITCEVVDCTAAATRSLHPRRMLLFYSAPRQRFDANNFEECESWSPLRLPACCAQFCTSMPFAVLPWALPWRRGVQRAPRAADGLARSIAARDRLAAAADCCVHRLPCESPAARAGAGLDRHRIECGLGVQSCALLLTDWIAPNAVGYAFVIGQAAVTAVFAELEYLGLRNSAELAY